MPLSKLRFLQVSLVCLALANAYLDLSWIRITKHYATQRERPLSHYTFIEDDLPTSLSLMSPRPAVMMSMEETTRYSLTNPEGSDEWLWAGPVGDQEVRLGPNNRFFSLAFTHELHCMQRMFGILQREEAIPEDEAGHSTHCLNVLRHSVLCGADITLEPPDVLTRNISSERFIADYQCVDWQAMYKAMRKNWLEWKGQRARYAQPVL